MISVRGPDATKLLQKITTNDIEKFERDGPSRAALYSGLKTIDHARPFGIIVLKPNLAGQTSDNMEYWVDIVKNDVPDFLKYSQEAMEKIQAQVTFNDLSSSVKPFAI